MHARENSAKFQFFIFKKRIFGHCVIQCHIDCNLHLWQNKCKVDIHVGWQYFFIYYHMVSPHRSVNKQLDQANQHTTGCRQYHPLYQEASIQAQRGIVFS